MRGVRRIERTTLPTAAAAAATAAAVGIGHMLLKEGAERAGDGFRQSFFHAGPEDLIAVRGAGRDGGREGGREGGWEGG